MNLPEGAELRADLRRAVQDAGEEPVERVLEALALHLELLARWNPRYNLTRIQRWEEILDRHVKESLLPLRWIGAEGRLLDVGSGNGFPALPILICRPGVKATLVERSDRKALFLDAVVREAGLGGVEIAVTDLGPRAPAGSSKLERPLSGPFDYVISRATLPPRQLLALSMSWARPGGRIFIFGGAALEVADSARPGGSLRSGHQAEPRPVNRGEDHPVAGVRRLAREAIPGRKSSFLWVFQMGG